MEVRTEQTTQKCLRPLLFFLLPINSDRTLSLQTIISRRGQLEQLTFAMLKAFNMQLISLSTLGLLISHFGSSASAFSLRPVYSSHRPLWSTRTTDVEDPTAERLFESADFLEVVLSEHKPLGCTVEESLASAVIESGDNTQTKLDYVFLSAVKPGGNADKAGLLVGDVVVGVTGIFGELENVAGLGIDKV